MADPIPPGTLDLLILATLAVRTTPLHGFEIAEAIERRSANVFRVVEGSLYPALQRLLANGWASADWGRTTANRRARYYELTASGRKALETELATHQRVASAIDRVLRAS